MTHKTREFIGWSALGLIAMSTIGLLFILYNNSVLTLLIIITIVLIIIGIVILYTIIATMPSGAVLDGLRRELTIVIEEHDEAIEEHKKATEELRRATEEYFPDQNLGT